MTRTFGRRDRATVLFPNTPKVGVPTVGDSSYEARAVHLPWIWRKDNSVQQDQRHDEIVEMAIASCKAPSLNSGGQRDGYRGDGPRGGVRRAPIDELPGALEHR